MGRALHHALYGAVLTVIGIAGTYTAVFVVTPDLVAALPGFGSGGDAAMVYRTLGATAGLVAFLAASVGVGYREQRRHDVRHAYRRFGAAVGAGGVAAVVLAATALALGVSPGTVTPAIYAATVLSAAVSVPLVVVVAALAGVTLSVLDTGWRRAEARFGRPLAVPVGAAAVAGLSVAVDGVTGLLASTGEFGVPGWLPAVGSVGETVAVYSSLDTALAGLVLVGGGVALGVVAARRYGFDESVRRFAVLGAVGSGAGVTAALAAGTALVGTVARSPSALASLANTVLWTGLVGVLAAVVGLGGAAFEASGPDGSREGAAAPGDATDPVDSGPDRDPDRRPEFAPRDGTGQ